MYILFIIIYLTNAVEPLFAQDENLPPRQEARLAFVGDVFLGNWAEEFIVKYGVDYPYLECKEIFIDADLVAANLESPLTEGGTIFPKEYNLKSPPGCQTGLYEANIRAVTLANNHIMDFGLSALIETFASLDSSDIQYFGAGLNREEALKEASFNLREQTFALIGFSATFPEEFWATDTSAGTAFPYEEDLLRVIPRLDSLYDAVIVSFHWSAEKREYPKDYQVELAHICIELGADLIIGHHPHVVQGVEIYQGVPIFYSLGNFAFASYSETARIGLIAVVDFVEGKAFNIKAIPINVFNAEVNFQPQLIQDGEKSEFYDYLLSISLELNQKPIVISKGGFITVKTLHR